MNNLLDRLNEIGFSPECYYNELDGFDYDGKDIITQKWREENPNYDDIRKLEKELMAKQIGYEFEEVEQVGGVGEGDHYHVVLRFTELETNEEIYLRANASYQSHHGVDDWGDWEVVTKQEKTITVYE